MLVSCLERQRFANAFVCFFALAVRSGVYVSQRSHLATMADT